MKLSSQSFSDNQLMDTRLAYAKQDPDSHIALSNNLSPQFSWSDVPENTRSFAIVCIDPDVPGSMDNVNQEGKTLPVDLPRVDFFHWAMVDIPADTREFAEGQFSKEVTPKGKGPELPAPLRHALNNYTEFMKGDPEQAGEYFGYDGPCPPFNDERMHDYIFTLYALDVEKLDLEGTFTGQDVLEAIKGHILDQASLTGKYTLNPDVKA